MMEPLKILASSLDDERQRSTSPEVASEMDSFMDNMDAPESSRVVEEYSESHHKHHHQGMTTHVKGATLNMRNMQSNIKLPNSTHQFLNRGSLTSPLNFNSSIVSKNTSPHNNTVMGNLLALQSPQSQSGASSSENKGFIINRLTQGAAQTSKEKLSSMDIL